VSPAANRWRNPADDLPADFEDRRVEHYQALRKTLHPTAFIGELRAEIRAELDALHQALPTCDWLEISDRASGTIKLTPLDAAPEPRNLRQLKRAVQTRWGTVPLIQESQTGKAVAPLLGPHEAASPPRGPGQLTGWPAAAVSVRAPHLSRDKTLA
jgi:hypothetical protein